MKLVVVEDLVLQVVEFDIDNIHTEMAVIE